MYQPKLDQTKLNSGAQAVVLVVGSVCWVMRCPVRTPAPPLCTASQTPPPIVLPKHSPKHARTHPIARTHIHTDTHTNTPSHAVRA